MSKLEEVSHKMLVLMFLRVLCRVPGFPVVSRCLWGELQNVSFSNVYKQVLMFFGVVVVFVQVSGCPVASPCL